MRALLSPPALTCLVERLGRYKIELTRRRRLLRLAFGLRRVERRVEARGDVRQQVLGHARRERAVVRVRLLVVRRARLLLGQQPHALEQRAADARPHPNGAAGIYSLVGTTPDLHATVDAFGAAGLELRRLRALYWTLARNEWRAAARIQAASVCGTGSRWPS